ncbi:MAG: DCC1-like thiol-disulfide oxidoreductase family protein [Rhodospirillales bacterium]
MALPRPLALPTALRALPQPLFVFDGVCVLCSRTVRFTLQRERDTALRFAPAQSDIGQAVFKALGLPNDFYETLVVLADDRAYVKSAAVLRLAQRLRQPWRGLGAVASLLPRALLDWLYDRMARSRYKMFGRYDACMVPEPALASRFVVGTSQPR